MKLLFDTPKRYSRRFKTAPKSACRPAAFSAVAAASSVFLSFSYSFSTPATGQTTSLRNTLIAGATLPASKAGGKPTGQTISQTTGQSTSQTTGQSTGAATGQQTSLPAAQSTAKTVVPKNGGGTGVAVTPPAGNQPLSPEIKSMSSFYKMGKYVQAEIIGREILKTSPTNLQAHYLLGNVYFSLKDPTDAAMQYNYCIKAGQNTPVAKLATTALATLKANFKDLDKSAPGDPAPKTKGTPPAAAQAVPEKPASLESLKQAEKILQRAQDNLAYKKKQLDTEITHTEEFARSRIKEIPFNTIYRRMSAFAGIEAARDSEDYYAAPNYDRPAEVAKIRGSETAKVQRFVDEYNALERKIVTAALAEVDAILGGTSDPDAKLQAATTTTTTTTTAAPATDTTKQKVATNTYDACAMCGITSQKEREGHRVIMVATGSAAHRAGMAPGDLIVQSTFIPGADLLKLTIWRIGKHYSLVMHPQVSAENAAAIQRQTPSKISAAAVAAAAVAAAKPSSGQLAWARIKGSEIAFVEDMSANMRLPLGETGLSRWDWAAGRIVDFAESLSKVSPMGFTLVQCYQNVYETYRDQNPTGLRQRLAGARAMDASNLTTPLEFVANDYFDSGNRKPLLIMVFTDGRPERGESLEVAVKTILDRAKSPDQVRLVFFQIGDDPQGTSMLQMLDNDLTYAGSKHDIVDYVNFGELQESGISRALVDAYDRPRAPGKTTPPPMSQALAAKLEQVQKQMAALH